MEQKILEVEADISKAEAKAEKAEADKKAEDLGYWRNKTAQLRGKESQLRAEKARVEVQQQGTMLCSPLKMSVVNFMKILRHQILSGYSGFWQQCNVNMHRTISRCCAIDMIGTSQLYNLPIHYRNCLATFTFGSQPH